jgi:hypothetical protein
VRLAVAPLLLALTVPARAADPVDFRSQVYPILHDRCFRCHQGADAKSGIRLDRRADLLAHTRPGRPDQSRLIAVVETDDLDTKMPQTGGKLTAAQVGTLRAWVEQGVKWDDTLLPPAAAAEKHWAFQSVKRPAIPAGVGGRNPVDAFVMAKLREKGLTEAPEADRRVLLRRLSLDLTGLPPAAEEIDAFLADRSVDAYEKQVERFLASPAYGERWGRHWLDVARYADSEGYESDHVRPYAWRYRDWVVKAFNDDLPYDRFVTAQLAGDELTPYRDENLIATGFLAAARLSSNEEDVARQFNDVYVDVANTAAAAFLGLTLNCAQCHAHKFDPVTAPDYYRFQGFFLTGMPNNLALRDPAGWAAYEAAKPPGYDAARRAYDDMLAAAKAALEAKARAALPPDQRAAYDVPPHRRTPAQHAAAVQAELKFQFTAAQKENAIPAADKARYGELKKQIAAIEEKLPDPPQTWGFYAPAGPHRVGGLQMRGFYPPAFDADRLRSARPFVLLAGDAHRRGAAVDVGWPAFFGPTPPSVVKAPRTALAEWLTRPGHPLTARVWANRVWHYHFGRGIVDTGGDFGLRGSPPTHPDLLDWLAAELVEHGWSTKHLHRLIVTSAAYRQASRGDPASVARDPDNRYLTRWKPRRLEAEGVRDALLAASGELDRTVGGRPAVEELKSLRRGLYLLQKRQRPSAVQTLFDGPTGATESCPRRLESETPLSALFLLNNPFTADRARGFADRVRRLAGNDPAAQATTAFRLALGRAPSPAERAAVAEFFATAVPARDPLRDLCHALFLANEFTTIE